MYKRQALQSAVDDCASLTAGRGIASAEQRNEHRAYYACGALFGLVVYGVYDFTNYATLRHWPFALTLVDVAWGTLASAVAATAARIVVR